MSVKQLIIVRKDLEMSPGKLAAQVAHASMAFLSYDCMRGDLIEEDENFIKRSVMIDSEVYHDWLCSDYRKVICAAKNLNHLNKAAQLAEELDLIENTDFFFIKDRCYTELIPETLDDEGNPCTVTCLGFRPLHSDLAEKLSKKYQLYT